MMTQERLHIKKLINDGLSIVNRMDICTNTHAGKNTLQLKTIIKQLFPLTQTDYPTISTILSKAETRLIDRGIINAFFFGDIRTSLTILKSEYDKSRKIFISHSSKDKNIIAEFVDHILQLGIGIDAQNIFCTSIEDLGVKNGNDIREHIKNNIQTSDFSLLMISNNYKHSEICLNEMGAVWSYNNQVRYYLLPNTDYDSIGWLCNPNKADTIDNPITLDALHNEMLEFYKLPDNGIEWSRHRQTFLDNIAKYIDKIEDVSPQSNIQSPSATNITDIILNLLKDRPDSTIYDIETTLGYSRNTISRHLSKLLSENRIIEENSPKVRKYRLACE